VIELQAVQLEAGVHEDVGDVARHGTRLGACELDEETAVVLTDGLDVRPHPQEDGCARGIAALDAENGARRRCVDEPDKQIVRIEWDSADGHLQGFRRSPDFKPFLEATQPFYKDIEEMTHYQVKVRG
jgi:hypothetical protein